MCGIVGAVSADGSPPLERRTVERMLTVLEHRGPEMAGAWAGRDVVLGHARLSIVDVAGGLQPLANEDETIWVVVNGEVFNHVELRSDLEARGHRFRTASDSEVIVHLYEEKGVRLLDDLNGQYAFALWDDRAGRLLLARDRVGVHPLFFTVAGDTLLFASEIKALLTDGRVGRRPDIEALDQIFTYWAPLPGRTMFQGIREVPAGTYLIAGRGRRQPTLHRYWIPTFGPSDRAADGADPERLRELLMDAVKLRLRADVPVGAYLSGGLDSSAVAAMSTLLGQRLQTFSVAFTDSRFDERPFQEQVSRALGTDHHVVECTSRDVCEAFPEVVWHAETPLLRTAPVPLFLLSALVRRHGIKVVLTGEGADEFFAGYDIFKETLVRRFWARNPDSSLRPQLLRRLYATVPELGRSPQAYLQAFFGRGLRDVENPFYSHLLRWGSTSRLKRLFSPDVRHALSSYDSTPELHALLCPEFRSWDALSKAQYLEIATFLTPYLLSSQGERMAMSHSVEGRFPFLDHRVAELAGTVPPSQRMVGLQEKHFLKQAVAGLVPEAILSRPKQPYLAPASAAFRTGGADGYVSDLLAPGAVREAGLFDPVGVSQLRTKCLSGDRTGAADDMALTGVLSAQLWHAGFIRAPRPRPGAIRPDITWIERQPAARGALSAAHPTWIGGEA